jgi:hypothetical protein
VQLKRAVRLLNHRLAASKDRDTASNDILLLLTAIMQKAKSTLSPIDLTILKEYVFHQSAPVRELCLTPFLSNVVREGRLFLRFNTSLNAIYPGLNSLVHASLDPEDISDKKTAADIGSHWLSVLRTSLDFRGPLDVSSSIPAMA